MKRVGAQSYILKTSDVLRARLTEAGKREHIPAQNALFREDDGNVGVFLIVKGKVCLSVRNVPKLDRLLGNGSLLGLPSTFTGRPYSLTAVAVSESEVVHVSQEDFLQLMREQTELCREATDMLGREVTFIQSALAERRKQVALKKVPSEDRVAVS
ncbi:MAG: cyclic nucleotide-binding domain-containing protein [Candidatus Korobacteraceae bacterium]